MSGFTHFNEDGNAVMVDVGEKAETKREALASGVIRMSEECFQKVKEGSMKKGDVLGVARIAGIMGAKKTAELIPLCHLLNLTKVEIDFEYLEEEHGIRAICHTACTGRTGVEMEALTAVNVALLTIYDMCKAMDRGMEISGIHLVEKSGGKSGRNLSGDRPGPRRRGNFLAHSKRFRFKGRRARARGVQRNFSKSGTKRT